jgi:hypothetical protein
MNRWAEGRAKRTLSGKGFPSPVVTARMFVMAGQKQQALDWLERGCEQRHINIVGIGMNPVFKGLRDEPRFQELLRRMNFPEDVIARILEKTQ